MGKISETKNSTDIENVIAKLCGHETAEKGKNSSFATDNEMKKNKTSNSSNQESFENSTDSFQISSQSEFGNPLLRAGLWLFLALVVIITLTTLLADAGRVFKLIVSIAPSWIAAIILAVCSNYILRFLKWTWFLRRLDLEVNLSDSLWIFFSAFTMVLSPGKFGELVKSLLLRNRYGYPIASTAPIVMAERLTDLLGLIVLALIGGWRLTTGFVGLIIFALSLSIGIFLITRPEFWLFLDEKFINRFSKLSRFRNSLKILESSTQNLLSLKVLSLAVPLSALSWAGEGVALYFIFRAFEVNLPELLSLSVFAHALGSVLGALSLLPGGLGVTEGTLGGLFVLSGMEREVAISATLLIRAVTLWFAVFVGAIIYLLGRRKGDVF